MRPKPMMEYGVAGVHSSPGGLAENGLDVGIAVEDSAGFNLAGGFIVSGDEPSPGAQTATATEGKMWARA